MIGPTSTFYEPDDVSHQVQEARYQQWIDSYSSQQQQQIPYSSQSAAQMQNQFNFVHRLFTPPDSRYSSESVAGTATQAQPNVGHTSSSQLNDAVSSYANQQHQHPQQNNVEMYHNYYPEPTAAHSYHHQSYSGPSDAATQYAPHPPEQLMPQPVQSSSNPRSQASSQSPNSWTEDSMYSNTASSRSGRPPPPSSAPSRTSTTTTAPTTAVPIVAAKRGGKASASPTKTSAKRKRSKKSPEVRESESESDDDDGYDMGGGISVGMGGLGVGSRGGNLSRL